MSFHGLQKMEQQFINYPQARILQLEDEVRREVKCQRELTKELQNVRECRWQQQVISEEVQSIHEKVSKSATQISSELAPAAVKTLKLKQHIVELYQKLGYSDNLSQYHMLCAAEEWEALDGPVTKMLQNQPKVDSDQQE